ncbi:GntR family transcriptional regulator [Actinospica sp. MGRD01-02]|uniref:GntR family transcriptional regulator n=1 Tax=Actinospica acidithermotolerans TaxID=2828514 RepID=A0A941EHD1_9ACTN|nr:GntR family transcriptional regulator [Actinospica acidithermotolerans]MBR7831321.1 GntR family transcriptional regulator [Actinospica acidithermotolerans]
MADSDGPIVRSTLTEQITSRLRAALNDGSFPVGQPIPSEHELMNRYGVSRNVVRAAISQLRGEGLILTVRGVGSFPAQTVRDLPRTSGDPWDTLIPTKDPLMRRDYADRETAARFAVPDRMMMLITERPATREDTGQKVLTARAMPASAFFNIEPSPKPFEMTRAELIDLFTRHHGPLTEEYGFQAVAADPDQALELALPTRAPLMEITRYTRGAQGQLLMTETEISTGPGTRHITTRTPLS